MKAKDLRIVPLYFMGQGALIEPHPVCKEIFNLAAIYCKENVRGDVNLSSFAWTKVLVEFDEQDKAVAVHGISGAGQRPDISLFRVTGDHAKIGTKLIHDSWQGTFADAGYRGQDVFIHVKTDDEPAQMCPNWKTSMKELACRNAERFLVKVK